MKNKTKKLYKVTGLFLTALVVYLFWGPLFPWNPIKIGYTKINTPKAAIYISNITPKDSVVYHIGEIISEEEWFHDLKYKNKVKIVILEVDSKMKRYLPWLKGSRYSVSLSMADLIYIGPTARKSSAGIKTHLKHELSHLLIDQNTTRSAARTIHNQGWFAEGIAEYFSGHKLLTKAEFVELCKSKNIRFISLLEENPLNMNINEIRLRYTFYKYFIEFLIKDYGIERFHQYLKKYIINPRDYKKLFPEIYAADLNELLSKFNLYMNIPQ
jgi:hypothetical protein